MVYLQSASTATLKVHAIILCISGLRQSLATAGALMGTAIAPIVFIATGSSYVLTFTAAIIPPAIALLWLLTVSNTAVTVTMLDDATHSAPATNM